MFQFLRMACLDQAVKIGLAAAVLLASAGPSLGAQKQYPLPAPIPIIAIKTASMNNRQRSPFTLGSPSLYRSVNARQNGFGSDPMHPEGPGQRIGIIIERAPGGPAVKATFSLLKAKFFLTMPLRPIWPSCGAE